MAGEDGGCEGTRPLWSRGLRSQNSWPCSPVGTSSLAFSGHDVNPCGRGAGEQRRETQRRRVSRGASVGEPEGPGLAVKSGRT